MPLFERRHILSAILGILGSLLFCYLTLNENMPVVVFLYHILKMFKPIHIVNFIAYSENLPITPQILFYVAGIILIFLGVLYYLFKKIYYKDNIKVSFLIDDVLKGLCLIVIFGLGAQSVSHFNISKELLKKNKNLSIDQRYTAQFKDIHLFAKFCKQYIDPDKSVEYVSDLDLNTDPGQLIHRVSAYFLYPIDIRNIRGDRVEGSSDYIICLFKKYDPDSVPMGYTLHAQFSHNAYILKRI